MKQNALREAIKQPMKKKAVVLSSGGVDSTTAMAIANHEGYEIYSLSFRYGQRHEGKPAVNVTVVFQEKRGLKKPESLIQRFT